MKHPALNFLAVVFAAVVFFPSAAIPAPVNEPVFKSGNWFVVRTTKPDGAVTCTAFYRAHREVQLSQDELIVKLPKAVDRVAVGYDGAPAPPRALDAAEQQMGAVVIRGAQFERLRQSRQLRFDVFGAEGKTSHDLQLAGIAQALDNIAAGCPEPPEGLRVRRGASGIGAQQPGGIGNCPARMVARMRANGVAEEKISARCS